LSRRADGVADLADLQVDGHVRGCGGARRAGAQEERGDPDEPDRPSMLGHFPPPAASMTDPKALAPYLRMAYHQNAYDVFGVSSRRR